MDLDGGDLDTDGGDPGPDPELDWADAQMPYRQIVTLQAHPDRDRTDLPIIAVIEHPGKYVLRNISVYEVTGGMPPTQLAAATWCEPDGRLTQVGFEAEGTTLTGQ